MLELHVRNPRLNDEGLQWSEHSTASLDLTRLSQGCLHLSGYVRNECIGTRGCEASPMLYGMPLNRSRGLSQCCIHQTVSNIVEANFTRESGGS